MAEVVLWNHYPKTNDLLFFCNLAAYRVLACESIRFSFALRRWGRFARRNVRHFFFWCNSGIIMQNYLLDQSALLTGFWTDFTSSVWNFCR